VACISFAPQAAAVLLQVAGHLAPQLALALFRAACFLLFVSTVTAQNVPPNRERPRWLAMFTHVAYIAFAAAMLLGAAITAQVRGRWLTGGRKGPAGGLPLPLPRRAAAHPSHPARLTPAARPRPWQAIRQGKRGGPAAAAPGAPPAPWPLAHKAHLLLYVTAAVSSLTAAAFYWLAIYRRGARVRWDAPIEHGGSAALLLADLLLSRSPIVSYHFQAPLLFVSAYTVFMWAWAGVTGEWLYETPWDQGLGVKAYAALAVIVGLSFLLLLLLAGLRERLAAGRCRAPWGCCGCCSREAGRLRDEERAAPWPGGGVGAASDGAQGAANGGPQQAQQVAKGCGWERRGLAASDGTGGTGVEAGVGLEQQQVRAA
jgi:hypothetical protein